MANRKEFIATLDQELSQAGRQKFRSQLFHNLLIFSNVVVGFTTTYLAGTGFEEKATLALLVGITTVAGTLEKTFAFGRAMTGFRKAKTQFENLKNDLMKVDGDEIPDEFVDKLNEIRQLKVELTDKT